MKNLTAIIVCPYLLIASALLSTLGCATHQYWGNYSPSPEAVQTTFGCPST